MKKAFLWLVLLSVMIFSCDSKVNKTIENPVFSAATSLTDGRVSIEKMEFTDDCTRLCMKWQPGMTDPVFMLDDNYCLTDYYGHSYRLTNRFGAAWKCSVGMEDFILEFEPMPDTTSVFDLCGTRWECPQILCIRAKDAAIDVMSFAEMSEKYQCEIPENWLKTDSIHVKVSMSDDYTQSPVSQYSVMQHDIFTNENIACRESVVDGGFECSFLAGSAMESYFVSNETFGNIRFFGVPGETTEVHVSKDGVSYGGSAKQVERLLKSDLNLDAIGYYYFAAFHGTAPQLVSLMDKILKEMMLRLQLVAHRDGFTPLEVQMSLATIQNSFLKMIPTCLNFNSPFFAIAPGEANNPTHADSLNYKELISFDTYKILSQMDFDNPCMIFDNNFNGILWNILMNEPVSGHVYMDFADDAMSGISRNDTIGLSFYYANRFMQSDSTLLSQCALLSCLPRVLDVYAAGADKADSVSRRCDSLLSHPYLKSCAKKIVEKRVGHAK